MAYILHTVNSDNSDSRVVYEDYVKARRAYWDIERLPLDEASKKYNLVELLCSYSDGKVYVIVHRDFSKELKFRGR